MDPTALSCLTPTIAAEPQYAYIRGCDSHCRRMMELVLRCTQGTAAAVTGGCCRLLQPLSQQKRLLLLNRRAGQWQVCTALPPKQDCNDYTLWDWKAQMDRSEGSRAALQRLAAHSCVPSIARRPCMTISLSCFATLHRLMLQCFTQFKLCACASDMKVLWCLKCMACMVHDHLIVHILTRRDANNWIQHEKTGAHAAANASERLGHNYSSSQNILTGAPLPGLALSITRQLRRPYPKEANVTKASSLPGQSGNRMNCTSPIKLASLNRSASPMCAGTPANQMQRETAVMPMPGLGRGTEGNTAQHHTTLVNSALHNACYVTGRIASMFLQDLTHLCPRL